MADRDFAAIAAAQRRSVLVQRFAGYMRRELAMNAWKGDHWSTDDPQMLDEEVLYHAAKLSLAIRLGDLTAIREYAADVGNCSAMVADRHGMLDHEAVPCEDQGGPMRDEDDLYGDVHALGGPDLRAIVRDFQESVAGLVAMRRGTAP